MIQSRTGHRSESDGTRTGPCGHCVTSGPCHSCFWTQDPGLHHTPAGYPLVMVRPTDLRGADRLIVALDVSSHEEALSLVDRLDNVSLFKIGLQLFLTGHILNLIKKIQDSRRGGGGVFLDLKLGGDIGNTIGSLVRDCRGLNVKFITLVHAEPHSLTIETLKRARAARGGDPYPCILYGPTSVEHDGTRCGGEDPRARGDVAWVGL